MTMAVPPKRKILQWLRRSAVVLVACYIALLLYVQVSERVMRRRAERLLSEMRELQVGKSTWADLQPIRSRWGAWGGYDGTCSEDHCDYTVGFKDVAGDPRFAMFVSLLGHGHAAIVSSRVVVEHGIVKQISYQLWVFVPKGYGTRWEREEPQVPGYIPYSSGEYVLMARARSRLDIEHRCCHWPNPIPHPNYILTKPGGCTNCLAIWTEFLPQVSLEDKLRLTTFNFNCITRWKPCADEEDIMPEVGAEYTRQTRASMIRWKRKEHCAYSVSELGAAALNAAVVQVESIPKTCSDSQGCLKLRLVKPLGGPAVWAANESVYVDASMEGPQGRLISEAFTARKPLIVLYPEGPKEKILLPYTCGLLPYNEQIEKDVTASLSLGKGIPESE